MEEEKMQWVPGNIRFKMIHIETKGEVAICISEGRVSSRQEEIGEDEIHHIEVSKTLYQKIADNSRKLHLLQ
jgi:hypothetical protein